MAFSKYEDRLAMQAVRSAGVTGSRGKGAFAVFLNNLPKKKAGRVCDPAFWKEQWYVCVAGIPCMSAVRDLSPTPCHRSTRDGKGSPERTLVDCYLDKYVAGGCRHSTKGAARRAAEIRKAWEGHEDDGFQATTLEAIETTCRPWAGVQHEIGGPSGSAQPDSGLMAQQSLTGLE
jgi:hypothetical protein